MSDQPEILLHPAPEPRPPVPRSLDERWIVFRFFGWFFRWVASGIVACCSYLALFNWSGIWSGQGEGVAFRFSIPMALGVAFFLYLGGAVLTLLCAVETQLFRQANRR